MLAWNGSTMVAKMQRLKIVDAASLEYFVRMAKPAKQKLVNCWTELWNLLSLRHFVALF